MPAADMTCSTLVRYQMEASPQVTRRVASPKAGALYHLTSVLDVYGNVSRGFKQSDDVIDNPTLSLITAWAYESGIKLSAGSNVDASVALFRTDVSNEQTFNPITLESTSGGRSRGQALSWA